MRMVEGIEKTEGVCGGEPRIEGKRITVSTLAILIKEGADGSTLLKLYPALCRKDLENAVRYIEENREEIEALVRDYEVASMD